MSRKILGGGRIPIRLWVDQMEDGAMKQARNLSNLPFAFRHVAIMPDCHEGFGMPIGGVLATTGVIIPNAVGVDIGCGMCAVKTSLRSIERDVLHKVVGTLKQVIPLGFSHHKLAQPEDLMPKNHDLRKLPVSSREYHSARHQVGTLGGGNHFIEFQRGSDGHVWIMIHSGSRNIGKQVADHYNRLAGKFNEQWGMPQFKQQQLAYLPVDSDEGQTYISEMNYCIDFALANRSLMMQRSLEVLGDLTGAVPLPFEGQEMINIAHKGLSVCSVAD
ncbi:MAG TPA: RtcB family protein [Bacteroidales bacterium]|nr:RtcB family protein [Bacteroidales bacterium]